MLGSSRRTGTCRPAFALSFLLASPRICCSSPQQLACPLKQIVVQFVDWVGELDSTVCLTNRFLSFRLDYLLIYIPCWLFLFHSFAETAVSLHARHSRYICECAWTPLRIGCTRARVFVACILMREVRLFSSLSLPVAASASLRNIWTFPPQEEKRIMDIVKAEALTTCQPDIAAFAESAPAPSLPL